MKRNATIVIFIVLLSSTMYSQQKKIKENNISTTKKKVLAIKTFTTNNYLGKISAINPNSKLIDTSNLKKSTNTKIQLDKPLISIPRTTIDFF